MSLAKTAICVVSEPGNIVQKAEVVSEPEPLLVWLQTLDGGIGALGLEAGPLSQWLNRGLTDQRNLTSLQRKLSSQLQQPGAHLRAILAGRLRAAAL